MPDKRGMKPYMLLVEAMKEMNKVAIGRIVVRSKERLVAIRADRRHAVHRDDALRRRGRRRATISIPDEDVELTERERAMARQLVESLAVDEFQPEKYHDEYREQVLDLIERKAAGEEIVRRAGGRAAGASVLDLVAALEASLAKADTAKDRHPTAATKKATAKKPAAKKTTAKKKSA